jgi:hypothetical protein
MTDQRLAWLNAVLALRHKLHGRDEPRWVWCEHCDRVGEASVGHPQRCVVCAPHPEVEHRLAAEARKRVCRALRSGRPQ